MKIVCLGWGSLIWNPGNLRIKSGSRWQNDGPLLPIEFARKSRDGRITLVITPDAKPVQVYWILLDSDSLEDAISNLATRENTTRGNIGSLNLHIPADDNDSIQKTIREWSITKNLDAVVWTNLPPRFNEQIGIKPSEDELIQYLKELDSETKKRAEEYVRKAPKQIRTHYRKIIEMKLGWTCISEI